VVRGQLVGMGRAGSIPVTVSRAAASGLKMKVSSANVRLSKAFLFPRHAFLSLCE